MRLPAPMTDHTSDEPLPGSFGLSVIGGSVGTAIHIGQVIIGDSSVFTHAFMVLDNNEIIEAQPGGAEIGSLDTYLDRPEGTVAFCDKPIQDAVDEYLGFRPSLYEMVLRQDVVREARAMEGTPYNFLDYAVLALVRFGISPNILRKRMADTGHLICSQLVDEAYRRAGIHLFRDNRFPAEVTPGDLDRYRRGLTVNLSKE